VKVQVYHILGTLMSYYQRIQTMRSGFFLIGGCFIAASQFFSD